MAASRPARVKEAQRRLEEELWVDSRANAAYEAYRARGAMKDGRRFGRPPNAYQPPATPTGKVNVTDPDSRNVKTPRGYMQGYNVQAVVTTGQVVTAAEINTVTRPDSERGGGLYRKRQGMIEPVFAQTKFNRRFDLPTPRQSCLPVGVAADHRDPQSPQAPSPPDHHRRGLKGR